MLLQFWRTWILVSANRLNNGQYTVQVGLHTVSVSNNRSSYHRSDGCARGQHFRAIETLPLPIPSAFCLFLVRTWWLIIAVAHYRVVRATPYPEEVAQRSTRAVDDRGLAASTMAGPWNHQNVGYNANACMRVTLMLLEKSARCDACRLKKRSRAMQKLVRITVRRVSKGTNGLFKFKTWTLRPFSLSLYFAIDIHGVTSSLR